MVTKDDIEGFLDRLSVGGGTYKEVESGLWVVRPGGSLEFDLVVHYSPPVVLLRVKVIDLPRDADAVSRLSRRLLQMNASDMVHGSYGIEQESVVVTEALELAHLDYEEFLAAYEGIALALASHLREIGSFTSAKRAGNGAQPRGKPQRRGRVKRAAKAVAKAVSKVKRKAVRRARKRGGR
jgi:hypothetical protein